MRIDFLCRHPHFLPTLAEWMYREWYQNVGLTFDQAVNELKQRLHEDELPLVLVAFADEALGMASILEDVAPEGYEFIACLAGLYVAPARRCQGVGVCLCQRALLEAQRLGHAKLSLYTPDQEAYYARLGWVKCVETVVETGDTHQIATFMEYAVDAVAGDKKRGLRQVSLGKGDEVTRNLSLKPCG
jgi:predicted N-acetyltransferase YhbS